ncbi:MAG: hypothetical protein U0931_18345 [Vulcanimicrobiota bacterium]
MQIQSIPRFNQPQIKTQLPHHFENEDDHQNGPDWGDNPNPDGWTPNWAVVGSGAVGGLAGGAGLGMLAGKALAISPTPLLLVGSLLGVYVGVNIGLALSCKQ